MFTKLKRVLSCRLNQIHSDIPMMSRLSVNPVEHIKHTKGPPKLRSMLTFRFPNEILHGDCVGYLWPAQETAVRATAVG